MSRITRRRYLAAGGVAALAGCGSVNDGYGNYDPDGVSADGAGTTGAADSTGCAEPIERTDAGQQPPAVPSASERLPLPRSPSALRQEARSGGPPKDGIPSIDDPSFANAGSVGFLSEGDPVFGIVRDDVAKAYPQKVLVHHEIVNDTVGDQSLAVTYCPLTGTVLGFDRGETTFGVSGRLINNNLVMYDRVSEAWWPQVLATAIPGPWNEDPPTVSLREVRLVWTSWERWRTHHPETRVLTTDTGYARNYGRDPYGSYNPPSGHYKGGSTPFARLNPDDRFHPKRVFIGARTPAGAVAFGKEALLEAGVMTGRLCETPTLAVADPRLETGYVYLNPERREFDHDGATVTAADGTDYRPENLPLQRIHAFDAMWFAWSGFYPWTSVHV
ncbi:DUF3179 domain-containing protein [Halapricum hydrolyticum]|uniref:DUF3179 domain-containing protein n=1 Tax=Halapricum hydrolyticum TaxID=2979991 RepID=A0AAE3LET1_9EURY|nr:DUF3179 domain-containing protein [Halapricum hydrolyticum]MCU4717719.1 DUF3179 domain-containing protein [Halapricum hydrolyticum]MCU4726752.1 DUF3179 domain-containing protein [Halapricum hydrolyticum]